LDQEIHACVRRPQVIGKRLNALLVRQLKLMEPG
jgi:hypothetical protein